MNLRERHSHTFKDPRKTERCDAAQLLAAGDALALALTGLHLKKGFEGVPECLGCDASDALAKWKKATDG